ncbi:MAG: ATP-binding protein [Pseudomonadota bacterium]
MISKNLIKEIILSNRTFILESVSGIVPRAAAEIVAPGKTVIMHGIRRSGKTFILYDIFRRNSDAALYLDFEDDRLTGFTADDFPMVQDAFLELRPEATGRIVYLFDEIQHVDGWERFCRRVTERENAAVYVTGSSSRLMPLEVDTAIRGRAWSVAVFPLSFPEFLQLRMGRLDDNEILYGTGKVETKRLFVEYAKWGGFPETALAVGPLDKTKLLKEYLRAMFFRDLVERYDMTNIALFDALADKLFSSFSTRLTLTAFYRQYKDLFPFSKDLLFQYFHNFEESMLIFAVRKFSESSYKRSRNPVKIYPADTGLCRRVASEDAGRILENIVFIELARRGREVYYFEEKQECDFVVKDGERAAGTGAEAGFAAKDGDGGGFAAFQVCRELTDENRRRETGGLIAACRRLNVTEGTILTDDQEWEEEAEGIKLFA